jgi:hypothetical protein
MIFFPLFSIFIISTIVYATCGLNDRSDPTSALHHRVEIASLVTALVSFGLTVAWVATDTVSKI